MKRHARAKLFATGGSQALRLPREFRIEGTEAFIYREGRRIVIEPVEGEWSPAMLKILMGPPDETMPEARSSQGWERREDFK